MDENNFVLRGIGVNLCGIWKILSLKLNLLCKFLVEIGFNIVCFF